MKYLKNFLYFKINESDNIDDILDRINKGEKITDVELKSRGINVNKFPQSNKTLPTVHLFYRDESEVHPSEATPQAIIFKMFDDYFNNFSIVEGYENDTSVGGMINNTDKLPKRIKWTIISDIKSDYASNELSIEENQFTGKKKIYVDRYIMLKDFRKLYPNWKFLVTYKFDYQVEKTLELGLESEEPWVSESNRLVIPFNYDGSHRKWYETSELCDKMGEHIKEYICQKFELKGDWELNTYSMRTERIGRLANHLLRKGIFGKNEICDEFHDGQITGKIKNGKRVLI